MKKLLAGLMMLALMVACVCFLCGQINASAESYQCYSYRIIKNEAWITDCDTSISGDITLPATFDGYPLTTIVGYAFSGCTNLTSVIVPDSVTSISGGAFSGCSSLESITIPFVGSRTVPDAYQYPFGYIFGTSRYSGGTATRQDYYNSRANSATYETYYITTY